MKEREERRRGRRTLWFPSGPVLLGAGSVAGEKEGKGPQAPWFDRILEDDRMGFETWEKAESEMLSNAAEIAVQRANLSLGEVDVMLAGDLLNQLMSSGFAARKLEIPYLGIYGACSTMTEGLLLASVLVDGGYCRRVLAAASSHYCTAERQFRMPLEHGNQRPPAAQWTATAAGAFVVAADDLPMPRITCATVGKVVDPGITDTHQMGAAMAPAAVDTLCTHFEDTGRGPQDYDRILTGDLGKVGSQIFRDLMLRKGHRLEDRYEDCGAVYYGPFQDAHSGGSGCGCSASYYAGRVYKELLQGKYRRVLLMSTGALMTTISSQQGESIPGVAHAVVVERDPG
ncbi:MAG: stage V sporulation protein AD [Clostridiales bacterium]|nr:stage V sporulation protein AD [Clostridiales bacterium]